MSPDAYVEMARVQHAHWWFSARRDILRARIADLGLAPDARILEVGSGTGANLEMLAGFGTVTGLEMSADALRFASELPVVQSGRANLLAGRCPEQLASIDGPFDLICLFDVLEHIEADEGALRELSRLLAPGGRIMVTVPAYDWLWTEHDVKLHHFRRYTRKSLCRAFGGAGLRISAVSHFNTLLFPLAVAQRLASHVTGQAPGGTEVPSGPVNALLRKIFATERHLLGRLDLRFGLSLMALATPAPAST
jgi:SAM-dependent methyltransferase